MKQQKYDEDIPEGHPAVETRDLKPDDQLLRRHGFKIHARPKNGPAMWAKQGEMFTEAAALRSVRS